MPFQKELELLQKALELINQSQHKLFQIPINKNIIIMGNSGTGKSTVANYLTNPKNMQVINYRVSDNPYGDEDNLVIDLKNSGDCKL